MTDWRKSRKGRVLFLGGPVNALLMLTLSRCAPSLVRIPRGA